MTLWLAGYAAIFNRRDAGRDIILPGAFDKTIASQMEVKFAKPQGLMPFLWQHNHSQRIGWVHDFEPDDLGLWIKASLDRPDGPAAAAAMSYRVRGLSFGYRARAYHRNYDGRTLSEIEMFEVSLVTHPMQPGACIMTIGETDD